MWPSVYPTPPPGTAFTRPERAEPPTSAFLPAVTFSGTTTSEGRGCAKLDLPADLGVGVMADGENKMSWPTLLLKLEAEVGTKCEVTAEEDVTVAAGQYKAAKVEMSTKDGKTTRCFAPGVGLVRMTSGGERALELKAFKQGK